MYGRGIAVAAVVGVVALTATGVRIGDHPAYVRVVVDFNGKVPEKQVEFDKIAPRMAAVHIAHPGITTATSGRTGEGVRVALQPGTQALQIAMSYDRRRFKYLSYAVVTGNHLAIDLWKSAPPTKAAEIKSGSCLSLESWHVTKGAVSASGTEHGVFEHTFQVLVRGAKGRVLGRRTVVHGGSWSASVRYHAAYRRSGTLEAVAFSAKDGALACIAQVRVTLPAT